MTKLSDSLTLPNGAVLTNRFVQPPMLTDGYATQLITTMLTRNLVE